MTVLVVLNTAAGSVPRAGGAALGGLIRDGLRQRGLAADVRVVEDGAIAALGEGFVAQAAQTAHGGAQPVLVAGGGDGTVGTLAAAVVGTGVALGVLPLGTRNHFARDLGIPLHLEAAMDVVAAGRTRAIDAAEVNGRVFVNNSSIGLYPFLVAERAIEQRRRGMSKLAAIGPALLRTLRASPWQTVRISATGDRGEIRTPCVFVGNNFYDLAALGRRESLAAAELCVYVVKPQTLAGLLVLPLKIVLGRIRPGQDVELLRVEHLDIAARRRLMRIATDGEVTKLAPPLHYRVRPAALRVVAPAEAPATATP